MAIVLIAFSEEKFKNHVNCTKWIRQRPEYEHLLHNKKWRLKSVAKSYYMSEEGCKVFQWHSHKLAYVRKIFMERPEPGVLIWKNDSPDRFTETDCPPLSNKYQRKRREIEFQLALKDQKRLDKEEERKTKKRKRESKTKKATPVLVPEGGLIKPKLKRRAGGKKKVKAEPEVSMELEPLALNEAETQALDALTQPIVVEENI